MLRDTFNDLGIFFEKIKIALLRRVFDRRKEIMHITECTLKYGVYENFP
jgi:hypothetical protein